MGKPSVYSLKHWTKKVLIWGKGWARRWRHSHYYWKWKIIEQWGQSAMERRRVPLQFFKVQENTTRCHQIQESPCSTVWICYMGKWGQVRRELSLLENPVRRTAASSGPGASWVLAVVFCLIGTVCTLSKQNTTELHKKSTNLREMLHGQSTGVTLLFWPLRKG